MAHAHVTQMPSRVGATISTTRRHDKFVKRRRLLLLALGVVLLTLAVLANYAPLHAYFDARGRLDEANAGIAELSAEKAELQAEMDRLSEADYLESLARQDLSYTRPGEELYIVTGASGGTSAGSNDTVTGQSGAPGFLERVLGPLLH